MEGDRYTNLFVSDLHCGSIYFDMLSFRRALDRIKEKRLKADTLHLMGDLIEGKLNYQGQGFESFPLDYQWSILKYVIMRLIDLVEPRYVHILPGNHDRKYSLNLLDGFILGVKKEIEDRGVELTYHRDKDFYIVNGVLVLHGITKSGGSDYTGLTPLILNNVLGLTRIYNVMVRYIVMGHYHTFTHLYYQGVNVFGVPGFQYNSKPLREVRGVLFLDGDGRNFPVLVPPSRREDIVNYWREKIEKIVKRELEE